MKKNLLFLIVITAFLGGCMYAYFNVYYNAEKYYNLAQKEEVNENGRPKSPAIQNYNKAIKKCGIILTEFKDSKWSDDALLLLAKCFYYKRSNYFQCIEKLQNLIDFYPDSELIPEAKLYMARAYYDSKKESEANTLLQDFLITKEYKDYHAEALLLLANYHLEKKEHTQANYFLDKLIKEYPRSEEYEEAFLKRGVSALDTEKYEEALDIFKNLIKKRVSKRTKLDAKYYILISLLNKEDFETTLKQIDKLLKKESKQNKIAKIKLVKARVLAKQEKFEEADELFENIIANNRRKLVAAEAYFRRGNMYFMQTGEYEKAIEHFKKVKSENSKSEFIEDAMSKSAVASRIVQFQDKNRKISIADLVDEQFKLAEYYLDVLNMPDSSVAVYRSIKKQPGKISDMIASAELKLDSLNNNLSDFMRFEKMADSLKIQIIKNDSLPSFESDSIDVMTIKDSLKYFNLMTAKADSQRSFIEQYREDLKQFDTEFIPFSHFVLTRIYLDSYKDTVAADKEVKILKEEYPDNRYAFAADQMLSGEEISLITPAKQELLDKYKSAEKRMYSNPDSALIIFRELTDADDDEISQKSLFSTAFVYYYILSDTTSAKPVLDSLLNIGNEEYKTYINRFYADGKYIITDKLPYLAELEELELQRLEEARLDSMRADSLRCDSLYADSLGISLDSLYIMKYGKSYKNEKEDKEKNKEEEKYVKRKKDKKPRKSTAENPEKSSKDKKEKELKEDKENPKETEEKDKTEEEEALPDTTKPKKRRSLFKALFG
ncbi:MAG: hypothetical protein CSB55_03010 [Candidatus Cloacimonadota bacterium]|nr:MAG: hypothetical protein CSB55_03010 [Candidatus Cloacimonadota bacterium]